MSFWDKLFNNAADTAVIPTPLTATTASADLSCTLKLWQNEEIIPNPTEADIRAAVLALNASELGPRLRLSMDGDGSQIQLSGTPRDGFALDFRERGADEEGYFYASRRCNYPADAAIEVLVAYRNGTADWSTMVEWKKLRL
jgi:hypothetical protein